MSLLFVIAILLGADAATPALPAGIGPADQPAAAVPPKQDPWYSATFGFERVVHGGVLRLRAAPGNILDTFTNANAAYNILYRSSNSHSLASWAVTTFLVPSSPVIGPDGATSLLSYQIDYDSADLDASPSYILSTVPRNVRGPDAPLLVQDIQEALARGWYVTVPDYEGPLASCELPHRRTMLERLDLMTRKLHWDFKQPTPHWMESRPLSRPE